MKSVKYSAVSKMKKQKEQEKVQSSFLHTLKEDDEICTGLLDTLSDDYLGYLEDLMGKKSGRETKISQNKHKNAKTSQQKDQQIDLNVKINHKQHVQNSPLKQQLKIQQESAQITSSVVFLQPKKEQQSQKIQKQLQKTQALQIPHKKSVQSKAQNTTITKQKHDLQELSSIPKRINTNQRDRSEEKILIKNIQGYLQSLSKIKHKPSIQDKIQFQNSKIYVDQPDFNEKSHSVTQRNKKQKQNTNDDSHNFEKKYQRFNFIRENQLSDIKQRKNHSEDKFAKNKQRIRYFDRKKFINQSQSDSQSSQNQLNPNDSSQISMDSYNNTTIPVQRNRFFIAQSKNKQNSKEKKQKDLEFLKKEKLRNQIFKDFSINQKDSSLELLLIKVIAKYNKLLNKHTKAKFRIQELQKELFISKKQSQLKDSQIERLKSINFQLQNDRQFFKNNIKYSKTNEIDDNKFLEEYGKDFFDRKADREIEQNLRKLNFRKKQKSKDGKAINIQEMFIIDNYELHKIKEKQNEKKIFDIQKYLKYEDIEDDFDLKRQKRSTSCRQASKNYRQLQKQPSRYQKTFKNEKQQQKNLTKRIQKGNNFIGKSNTPSYEKISKYKQNTYQESLRQRAYSESHNCLPKKTKKTSQDKKLNTNYQNQASKRSSKSNIKNKHNYNIKSSQSQQSQDQHEKMHKFNNNSLQSQNSKKFPNKWIEINNQQSQSTDSQLLEKLLTIQNTYRNKNLVKNQTNKMFFK